MIWRRGAAPVLRGGADAVSTVDALPLWAQPIINSQDAVANTAGGWSRRKTALAERATLHYIQTGEWWRATSYELMAKE